MSSTEDVYNLGEELAKAVKTPDGRRVVELIVRVLEMRMNTRVSKAMLDSTNAVESGEHGKITASIFEANLLDQQMKMYKDMMEEKR